MDPHRGRQRSTRARRVWVTLLVPPLLGLLPATPAISQAPPAEPPMVDATVQFTIGGVVLVASPEQFPGPKYAGAPAELTVAVNGLDGRVSGDTFESGTWSVDLERAGAPPGAVAAGEVAAPETTVALVEPTTLSDYDGAAGGGGGLKDRWVVQATNPGDPEATATVVVGARLRVVQEDGTDLTSNWPDADIVTKGRWRQRHCECWLGGTVLATQARRARMSFEIDVTDGQVIAVVMPTAPNRGKARIKLDGVNQGRVDTYSVTPENRVIMWQTPPLEAGPHKVEIINLATEGRPRIDVDAFLVTEGLQ